MGDEMATWISAVAELGYLDECKLRGVVSRKCFAQAPLTDAAHFPTLLGRPNLFRPCPALHLASRAYPAT